MKVINMDIINDLIRYGNEKSLEIKVKRVYYNCIKNRKIDLADKIQRKYRRFFSSRSDDAVMAFGFALMAEEAVKQKNNLH